MFKTKHTIQPYTTFTKPVLLLSFVKISEKNTIYPAARFKNLDSLLISPSLFFFINQ